jgi:SEC-C motif
VGFMDWIKTMFSSKPPLEERLRERGRNELCWCGSGKKYKRCHLREDSLKRVEERYAAQFAAGSQGGGIVPKGSAAKQAKAGRGLPPEAAPPPQG